MWEKLQNVQQMEKVWIVLRQYSVYHLVTEPGNSRHAYKLIWTLIGPKLTAVSLASSRRTTNNLDEASINAQRHPFIFLYFRCHIINGPICITSNITFGILMPILLSSTSDFGRLSNNRIATHCISARRCMCGYSGVYVPVCF